MHKLRETNYIIEQNHKTAMLSPDYDKISWDNFRSPIKIAMKRLVNDYRDISPYHSASMSKINLEDYDLK